MLYSQYSFLTILLVVQAALISLFPVYSITMVKAELAVKNNSQILGFLVKINFLPKYGLATTSNLLSLLAGTIKVLAEIFLSFNPSVFKVSLNQLLPTIS